MVVRRIREHVSTHDWFAVAIDVVIVVLGVFLGTQVNNWNEARIEAQQARDYRQRLVGEVAFNELQFATQAQYYRQARRYGVDALASLRGEAALDDTDFLIAAYQLSQIDTTRAKSFIYDEMTSTGLVTRLGGETLQRLASDYYLGLDASNRQVAETLPYRSMIREVMPYPVQKAIRDACGDRLARHQGRVVGVALLVPCPLKLDKEVAAEAARIVRQTPRLKESMTRYVASLDEKLDQLEPGVAFSRELRTRLTRGT